MIRRGFANKPPSKTEKPPAEPPKTEKKDIEAKSGSVTKTINYKYGYGDLFQFLNQGGKIEEIAKMEYKKMPYHITHNDPNSKDYIHSEYDDHTLATQIYDYNKIIDDFKTNLKLNQKYQEAFQKIQKKSRANLVRGNTRNVYDQVKDYNGFTDKRYDLDDDKIEEGLEILDNLRITINNSLWHVNLPQREHEKEYEKELENRPVNPDFNELKGGKYDVQVPKEKKHKHVADRLGHPEIFPTPLETLLRLEDSFTHPAYLNQPFIQIPTDKSDPTLDLNPGEVVYENPNVQEWYRFFVSSFLAGTVFGAVWIPFCMFVKNSTSHPRFRDEIYAPYVDTNFYAFDTLQLWPVFYLGACFFFIKNQITLINKIVRPKVIKVQYNQSKDLLFVTKVNKLGGVEEEIHEVGHIEWVPPYTKSVIQHADFSKEGIINLTDLNKHENLDLLNNDAYWNPKLKSSFLDGFSSLWDKSYYLEGVAKTPMEWQEEGVQQAKIN